MKRLILRGDDMGSCAEANAAFAEAIDAGHLKNVSLMACGPAFDEAAALLRERQGRCGIAIGLHVCLNAEWVSHKWGPVLPASRVPSLVDENGHLTPFPQDLKDRGASVDEMAAEVEAQVERAKDAGLTLTYMDEHMGVGWLPGLRPRLHEIAARHGLLTVDSGFAYLPKAPESASPVCYAGEKEMGGEGDRAEEILDDWAARLGAAPPGGYLVVTHPGRDEGTMRRFRTAGKPDDGSVARERDAERRAITSPRLAQILAACGAVTVRYDEAAGD